MLGIEPDENNPFMPFVCWPRVPLLPAVLSFGLRKENMLGLSVVGWLLLAGVLSLDFPNVYSLELSGWSLATFVVPNKLPIAGFGAKFPKTL